jgi:hypothetical protein
MAFLFWHAGSFAVNPATGEAVPVWVADYVLGSYGSGAIMAVPAHDARDFDFAAQYGLPVVRVVQPHTEEDAELPYTGARGREGAAFGSCLPCSEAVLCCPDFTWSAWPVLEPSARSEPASGCPPT